MRLIFVVLIGLIVFNVSLVMFAEYFQSPTDENPFQSSDITSDANYSTYKNIASGDIFTANFVNIFSTGLFIFSGFAVVGFISRGSINMNAFMGIGIIVSVLMALWRGLVDPIANITNDYGGSWIYTLIVIIIGIVSVFSLAEVLTGKGDI